MEGNDDRLPPLELGTIGPGEPNGQRDDESPSRLSAVPSWRRWTTVGVAAIVGVVLGAVGTNARNDATESDVTLIAGPIQPQFSADRSGSPPSIWAIDLVNSGPDETTILGVTIDGFETVPGADPPDPVVASPGEWVSVKVAATADCDNRPDGGISVRISDGTDERTVAAVSPPPYAGTVWSWQSGCELASGTGVLVGDAEPVSSDSTSTTLQLRVSNGREVPARVVSVESSTPGFIARSADLPSEVAVDRSAVIAVTWTVDDCADTADLTAVSVTLRVMEEARDVQVSQPLGSTALVELARLAERVCET